jgi:hypothetical protein
LYIAIAAPLPRSCSSRVLLDRLPTKVTKDRVRLSVIASSATKQGSCCVIVLPPREVSNVIQGVMESITISESDSDGRGSFYRYVKSFYCNLLTFYARRCYVTLD